MSLLIASWIMLFSDAGASLDSCGVIEGVVVNASQRNSLVPDTEVVLQLRLNEAFRPVESARTDREGRFRFEDLPVGAEYLYLPGANRDGIHYPGQRVKLTMRRNLSYVQISVRDTTGEPSPLRIRNLDVVLEQIDGALCVHETLQLENPTEQTYVGKGSAGDAMAETLVLGIPPEFDHLTFDDEFYGRQFLIHQGRVVTSIPWTPGRRVLRYQYTIPHERLSGPWVRRHTIPCDHAFIRVVAGSAQTVTSNVASSDFTAEDFDGFCFEQGEAAAGEQIVVNLDSYSRAWGIYAKWAAVAVLACLILAATTAMRLSTHPSPEFPSDGYSPSNPSLDTPAQAPASSPNSRNQRQRRRRAA